MSDVRVALGAFLLILGCSAAVAAPANPQIEPQALAAHVAVLADDSFGGRAPGTDGEHKTIDYIAQAFAAAGLKPLSGNSFSIPVPLQRATAVAGSIRAGDRVLANGEDAFVRAPLADGPVSVSGNLVFAGYGIRAAAAGRDDFAGADLKDKVVLMLAGRPPGSPDTLDAASSRSAKLRNAADAGARAAILIYDSAVDSAWAAVRGVVSGPAVSLAGTEAKTAGVAAIVNRKAAMQLAAAFGTSLDRLSAAALAPGFQPYSLGPIELHADNRLDGIRSANVAGVLPGRGRPDEYVIYVAHWDHLGRCAPAAADAICNGAVDNASGVGGLIEIARAFARHKRPRRSVVFLATTAEEDGLLGARHFVRSGPVAPARMVAAFGLDTIAASAPTRDVVILGQRLSTLDAWLGKAAKRSDRNLVDMPGVQSFYPRSDHYAFAEAGVPAVIATGIFAHGSSFQAFMRDHYHQPSDQPALPIDYTGAADDLRLVFDAGRALANSSKWPVWAKTSSYQRTK